MRVTANRTQATQGARVLHCTENGATAHITAPQKFAAPLEWPSSPLVDWPPHLMELYFDWMLVEYEGREQ